MHAWPPVPHTKFWLPSAQTFPSQQPLHVLGEHGMPQTPLTQTSFAFWQEVHATPPVPQTVSSAPERHTPPSASTLQQPLQFWAVHGVPGMHPEPA